MLHLLHVLRDNRTNETGLGDFSQAGGAWAATSHRDRQVNEVLADPFNVVLKATVALLYKLYSTIFYMLVENDNRLEAGILVGLV